MCRARIRSGSASEGGTIMRKLFILASLAAAIAALGASAAAAKPPGVNGKIVTRATTW